MFTLKDFGLFHTFTLIFLALSARLLAGKMLNSTHSVTHWLCAGGLFLIYTAAMPLMMLYFSCNVFTSPESGFLSCCAAFFVTNLGVLVTGFIYYLARSRRTLSEMEKLQLRDL